MIPLTDPFKDGVFYFDKRPTVEKGTEEFPIWVTVNLRDAEWEQYCDPDIYDCDKRIRAWAEEASQTIPKWKCINKYRQFALYQMFEILYGRPYEPAKDTAFALKMKHLLAFYSTSICKHCYDEKTKQWKSRPRYTLSSVKLADKPYSLKLRFEWLIEQGKTPTKRNMSLPKNELQVGHSRSKKTEANMQRRSQRAKQAYLDYQKRYREEHKQNRESKQSEDECSE